MRIVLSLVVIHKWYLHHIAIKNAFLNVHLTNTVFIKQPLGFIDHIFPYHVCRLKKALYGLKQDPRAWFQRLVRFLLVLGLYVAMKIHLFLSLKKGSNLLYLFVYVDEIILIRNGPKLVQLFISRINNEFATKDLGPLSYFLGLEASYTDDGLFITQTNIHMIFSIMLIDLNPNQCRHLCPSLSFLHRMVLYFKIQHYIVL